MKAKKTGQGAALEAQRQALKLQELQLEEVRENQKRLQEESNAKRRAARGRGTGSTASLISAEAQDGALRQLLGG